MWLQLEELISGETNAFNSDDFKRVQKTTTTDDKEAVCITFRDGGEILFNENYADILSKLK